MFLKRILSDGVSQLSDLIGKNTRQKKMCRLLSLLLFGPYFFAVLYKGGIGLLPHLVLSLGVGLSGLLFYFALKKGIYKERELPFFENTFLILTLVFFSFSYMYSTTKNVGLLELASLYCGAILIFLGYNLAKDKKHLNRLFGYITFSSFLSLIIGFTLFFTQPFERFAGTFNNLLEPWSAFPNAFGDFLLLTIPITFYVIEQRKKSAIHIFHRLPELTFMLSVAGLILTDSQGIHLVSIILFAALFVRSLIIQKLSKHLIMYTLIGVLIGYGSMGLKERVDFDYRETVHTDTEVIEPEIFENTHSINTRLEHFQVATQLMLKTPLFGFGPGSYPYISAQKLSLLNTADHPHNLFLKIGVENGLLTLFAFVSFLGVVLIRAFLIFLKKFDPGRELVCIGITFFLIHQMIDYNLNFTAITFLFYILLGTLMIERLHKSKRLHIREMKFINHFILIVFGLALTSFALHDGMLHAKTFQNPSPQKTLLKRTYYEDLALYQIHQGHNPTQTLEEGLSINPYNDTLHAFKEDYETAYTLNPHNLRHLLGLYESASPEYQMALREKTHNILEEYLFLLETNTHFTILSENPMNAFSIAYAIEAYELGIQIKDTFKREKEKFSRIYGITF